MEKARSTSKHRFLIAILAAAARRSRPSSRFRPAARPQAPARKQRRAPDRGPRHSRPDTRASQGTWTQSPTSFAYQWVRCPRNGGAPTARTAPRSAAPRRRSYVVATADVRPPAPRPRHRDERRRLARPSPRTRRPRSPTRTRAGPSTSRRRRSSGTAAQGQTLRVEPGTWNGRQPITFTFHWLRCDTAATTASSSRASTTTHTSSARATSARRSAPASSPATPWPGEPPDRAERRRAGPAGPARRDHAPERREVDPGHERARRPSGWSSTR